MRASQSRGRTGILRGGLLAAAALLAALSLAACDYARMKDDEALQTYQQALPQMPAKTIPSKGGSEIFRTANPDDLVNPVAYSAESVEEGSRRYAYYCVQCHGTRADGKGTVGQSFAPLPTNLRSATVREQTDGMLFYKIGFGFNRHPALVATVSEQHRWALVNYIRSLAREPKS